MKKKIGALVMIAVLIFSFAVLWSCGKEEKNRNSDLPKEEIASTKSTDDFEYDLYTTYAEIIYYKGKSEHVAVPDTLDGLPVLSVGMMAFADNEKIKDVTLPENLIRIDDDAFHSCMNLSSINLPSKLFSIGNNAFADCYALTSVVIPEGISVIGGNAFGGCAELGSVTLPEDPDVIGGGAFAYTKWIDSMKEDFVIVGDGILISYKGKDKEVTVPDGVKQVAGFYDCFGVNKVVLPDSVERISPYAFNNCSLMTLEMGSGVQDIMEHAFYTCSVLTSVNIPDSVKTIGRSAFSNCAMLEGLTVPSGTASVGDYAFSRCFKLTKLTVNGTETTLGTDIFESCTQKITIRGVSDSPAHKYARDKGYTFEQI